MDANKFAEALADTEGGPATSSWPDGGRALGPWQVHPDAFYSWLRMTGVQPALNETWDNYVCRLVERMFDQLIPNHTPTEIAMRWHLGHWSTPGAPDWDQEYADRFERFSA